MYKAEKHFHPYSGETIFGRRIEPGEVIFETDVYDSPDGKWKPSPLSNGILESSRGVIIVRPMPESAKVVLTPCDQGQYGIASCGACGTALSEWPAAPKCPQCDIVLLGTTVGKGFGGSDY